MPREFKWRPPMRLRLRLFILSIPTTLLAITFHLWTLPIVALQIARLVVFPSKQNAILLVIAIATSALFYFNSGLLLSYRQLRAIQLTLERAKDSFEAIEIDPNEFLGENVLGEALGPWSKNTRVRLVRLVRNGPGPAPRPLASYKIGGYTFIFLRGDPAKLTPIRKFILYHEIGHAESNNGIQILRGLSGRAMIIALSLWFLMTISVTVETVLAGLTLIAFLYTIRTRWEFDRRKANVDAEILADGFALRTMRVEDVRKLALEFNRAPEVVLPRDETLTIDGEERRLARMKQNIERTIREEPWSIPDLMLPHPISIGVTLVGIAFLARLTVRSFGCWSYAILLIAFIGGQLLFTWEYLVRVLKLASSVNDRLIYRNSHR